MRRIYTHCTRCLIWLGELQPGISASDARAALELMGYLHNFNIDEQDTVTPPACLDSPEAIIPCDKSTWVHWSVEECWWRRMWTLQEAILPPEACFLWDRLQISWTVVAGASQPKYVPAFDRLAWPHLAPINDLFTQVYGLEMARSGQEGPFWLSFRWGFRLASNPLDKVYGFLGLFPPGTLVRSERCNYRLPASKVYTLFTLDIMEHHQSLHPLALWNGFHVDAITQAMPSWAYSMGGDFMPPITTTPIRAPGDSMAWYLATNYNWFSASGDLATNWNHFRYDSSKDSLTLRGYLVDKIAMVASPLTSNDPDSTHVSDGRIIECIKAWYQKVETFLAELDQMQQCQPTTTFWPESFWRGLIGNLVSEVEMRPERVATSSDLSCVQQFVRSGQRSSGCVDIFATMTCRTMFVTEKGWLGFGSRFVETGDQVWVLRGANVPFVLRPVAQHANAHKGFTLLGPSYVHGVMLGEALENGVEEAIELY